MKKKMFLMACLAVFGMQVMMAQLNSIALHHEGKVTTFVGVKCEQRAMEAAVAGDTLYLNNGQFSETFTVTKPVTIIGNGTDMMVREMIIAIPDDVTLTQTLCKYMYIKNLTFTEAVSGVDVMYCKIDGVAFNATVKDSKFLSCFFGLFTINNNIQGMDVVTSKIQQLRGQTDVSALTFVNCNIETVNNDWTGIGDAGCVATYVNCILGAWDYTNDYYTNVTTYCNCLLHLSGSERVFYYSTRENCWNNTDFSVDDNVDCSLTDAQLAEAGYIGTDGTIIGCNGTQNPYTLTPKSPHVQEHKLEVNEIGTELKVTLKVGTE